MFNGLAALMLKLEIMLKLKLRMVSLLLQVLLL